VGTDVADWAQASQLLAPELLSPIYVANGASNAAYALVISPFATGLVVLATVATSAIVGVRVSGFVSAQDYYNVDQTTAIWPVVWVPVPGNVDDPYDVSITISPANPGPGQMLVGYVYQVFGAGVQNVQNSELQPLYVAEVPSPINRTFGPSLIPLKVGIAPAAGVSTTLVAGVTNQTLKVYGYDLSVRANVAANVGVYEAVIEDTTAAQTVASLDLDWVTAVGQANQKATLWIPHGITLPVSAGLKIVTSGGNAGAMSMFGTILYTSALYS
jgi:hypothetical protein